MKKLICTALIVFIVLASTFAVFAEEETDIDEPTDTTEEIVETVTPEDATENATEEDPALDESTFKKWLDEWRKTYEKEQEGKDNPDTFAEWLLGQVLAYGTEILAALAALFALSNAVYAKVKIKKPMDNFTAQTSGNLNKFAKDITEAVDQYGKESAEALEVVHAYARAMNTLEEEVKTLREKQIALEDERKALISAMKLQSGMLNTVIQSSTIAQWKKDQIGQLHTEATARIDELSNGGDRD